MSNQVFYALKFKGRAQPANEAGNVLKAATRAANCTFTTTLRPDGVSGVVNTEGVSAAAFESEVLMIDKIRFTETGSINFGRGNRLYFSTLGEGFMFASADPKLVQGAVAWKVERGEGSFAGATGNITSNFSVDDHGGVIDYQVAVLFLK